MAKMIKRKRPVKAKTKEEPAVSNTPPPVSKFPKKFFVFFLAFGVLAVIAYYGMKLFFVASVNGQLISRIKIIQELEKQSGKQVLDIFVLKALIEQDAKKNKIEVTKKDIDSEYAKLEKSVVAQGTTMDVLLAQQAMNKKELLEEIRLQLLVTKMAGEAQISNKEIDEYLSAFESQSLESGTETEAPSRESVKESLKKQKLQEKIQTYMSELKTKAKINYFVTY